MPSVFIIIVNWNGFWDTSECIRSILNISYDNYTIIVVDNSDKDESKELAKIFSEVITLRSETNLGFAGGNNLGIEYALGKGADYILLLNNDTTVEKDFLNILVDSASNNKNIGITVPQINYYNEPHKIWSAGGTISKIRGSGFAETNTWENKVERKDKSVSFVSGCCMLIKKEVIKKVGMFDEMFFLYVEDTDLCFRVLKAGYSINVVSKTKIYHKIKGSTRNNFSVLPLYYTTRNRLYFAKKNFGSIYLLTVLYIFTIMLLKSFGWVFTGKLMNIYTVYRAFIDFYFSRLGKTDHNNFQSS